jgi:hypothetical protein
VNYYYEDDGNHGYQGGECREIDGNGNSDDHLCVGKVGKGARFSQVTEMLFESLRSDKCTTSSVDNPMNHLPTPPRPHACTLTLVRARTRSYRQLIVRGWRTYLGFSKVFALSQKSDRKTTAVARRKEKGVGDIPGDALW